MDFFLLRDLFRDGGLASSSKTASDSDLGISDTSLSFVILGYRKTFKIKFVAVFLNDFDFEIFVIFLFCYGILRH